MATLWNSDSTLRLRHLIFAIIFALLFLWLVPIMQVRFSVDGQTFDKRIQRENDYRNSWVQAFGILGGVILIFLTLKRIGVAQEGQITERFSKAIDHLGATKKDGDRILITS